MNSPRRILALIDAENRKIRKLWPTGGVPCFACFNPRNDAGDLLAIASAAEKREIFTFPRFQTRWNIWNGSEY